MNHKVAQSDADNRQRRQPTVVCESLETGLSNRSKFVPVLLGLTLTFFAFIPQIQAQSSGKDFVSFATFMENTKGASPTQFIAQPQNKVQDAAAFEQMRQHILSLYQGVNVTHSFMLDSDHFDCVAVDQQPSVQILGLKEIATPPPASLLHKGAQANGSKSTEITSQLDPNKQSDEFGNSVKCEANTIPMRRVTLEEMSHFATLRNFLEKGPNGAGHANDPNALTPSAHKYSYTYQYVNNLGGNSNLNLWSPYVYTSLGEVFSLSQEWYISYNGTTQTAEVGWQNYPALYGGENSRLFIYYTADNYSTTGCYNLSCGAFVQVNNSWYFGGGFSNYSTYGGAQYDFSAEYYLYNGNWWLALGGTWVGYYPGSVYRGGQMSRYAQLIEFGTEGVGTTWFPPEGSGQWSSAGWSRAAYQRNLYYIASPTASYWDSLSVAQPSPHCYSISGPYSSTSSGWAVYFYEGGPGGTGC